MQIFMALFIFCTIYIFLYILAYLRYDYNGEDAPKLWCFILPCSETNCQMGEFGRMLQDLESRAKSLGICDYALESTTLEEVFM